MLLNCRCTFFVGFIFGITLSCCILYFLNEIESVIRKSFPKECTFTQEYKLPVKKHTASITNKYHQAKLQRNSHGSSSNIFTQKNYTLFSNLNLLFDETYDAEAYQLAQKVRILCWATTYKEVAEKKCNAIKDTWGKHCNVLIFISAENNENIPTLGATSNGGTLVFLSLDDIDFSYFYFQVYYYFPQFILICLILSFCYGFHYFVIVLFQWQYI